MKVSVEMGISAASFYEYLLTQVYEDLAKMGYENGLSTDTLDGFRYTRQLKRKKGEPLNIQMTIGPLLQNRYYEISYQTTTAKNRYFYDIKEVNDKRITVTYVEEHEASGSLNNWFYKTRVRFKEAALQKQIEDNLKAIETFIQRSNL